MYLVIYICWIYVLLAITTSNNGNDLQYQQYTFYYKTYQYPLNSHEQDLIINDTNTTQSNNTSINDISFSISIDNLSIHILKSSSRPYLIHIQHSNDNDDEISIAYDDDEAFNSIELWHTPHRYRRRLRTCTRRHRKKCGWWSYCTHTDRYYCPPIPPPNNNPYWLARYSHAGRFSGYYPSKHRLHAFTWHGCAAHCARWFGGLASINSAHENNLAEHVCKDVLLKPKPKPHSEYGNPKGWRGHSCYIGLTRPFKEWSDHRPVRFKKWHPGEPNNWGHQWGHREDCTELVILNGWHGNWNDLSCNHKRSCICQKPRGIVHGRYIGVQNMSPYSHASLYCNIHYGTELATIATDEDQKQANALCLKICLTWPPWCNCWIGLQRPHHEWDDGTNAEEKFTNWNPGQPDNYRKSEGCTELVAKGWGGRWNDLYCGHARYFICNAQTKLERMDFNDREEMIAKRINRHKMRWSQYQQEAQRKKIRKAFFDRMKQQRALMRKQRREQQQRQREYYRQMAFRSAMGNVGGFSGGRSYGSGGFGAFGGRSVFYGDDYDKKRRLRARIERESDGMKRMNELRMENERQKRKKKEETKLRKQILREIDNDALFYKSSNEEEELKEMENVNPSAKRCVFMSNDDSLYELCLNDEYVEVSTYIEKVLCDDRLEYRYDLMNNDSLSGYDLMDFERLQRFRYSSAMRSDDIENDGLMIKKVDDVQFVRVSEYIFDNENNHKKQCYKDENKYEICLEFEEIKNEMFIYLDQYKGYLMNEGHWVSFENDEKWNEIHDIENVDTKSQQIKKCVTYFDHKICVVRMLREIGDNVYDEYRVMLMKLNTRFDEDDDNQYDFL